MWRPGPLSARSRRRDAVGKSGNVLPHSKEPLGSCSQTSGGVIHAAAWEHGNRTAAVTSEDPGDGDERPHAFHDRILSSESGASKDWRGGGGRKCLQFEHLMFILHNKTGGAA